MSPRGCLGGEGGGGVSEVEKELGTRGGFKFLYHKEMLLFALGEIRLEVEYLNRPGFGKRFFNAICSELSELHCETANPKCPALSGLSVYISLKFLIVLKAGLVRRVL